MHRIDLRNSSFVIRHSSLFVLNHVSNRYRQLRVRLASFNGVINDASHRLAVADSELRSIQVSIFDIRIIDIDRLIDDVAFRRITAMSLRRWRELVTNIRASLKYVLYLSWITMNMINKYCNRRTRRHCDWCAVPIAKWLSLL